MSTTEGFLTRGDLLERWRITTEGRSVRAVREAFYRVVSQCGLKPFRGAGDGAVYRPADVLRAEEKLARRKGMGAR